MVPLGTAAVLQCAHNLYSICIRSTRGLYLELMQYVRILWRWMWLVVLGVTLAGTTAFVVSKLTRPTYAASTTFLINQAPVTGAALDYDTLLVDERLASTYTELLRRRPVLETVIASLALDTTADALAKKVKVAAIPETRLIELTVEDSNANRAAAIANELVRVLSRQNQELQTGRYATSRQNLEQQMALTQASLADAEAKLAALGTPTDPLQIAEQNRLRDAAEQYRASYASLRTSFEEVRLAEAQTTESFTVVEAARAEEVPVRPRVLLNTVLAAIVGAMFALMFIFLRAFLDTSIKSGDDVERAVGLPLLAAVAGAKSREPHAALTSSPTPPIALVEAYRTLLSSIDFAAVDGAIRHVVVASGGPFEGKSTTAANLAIAAARAGRRVILVDTDLRRPMLHTLFQQPNQRGVTTALLQREGAATDHLVPTGVDNLSLMASGPLPPNPAELLGSKRMAELLEELAGHADMVILDSPPVLAVVDAALLARACDAVLLVGRANVTKADALRRAMGRINQAGARLLGVVLNDVALSRSESYIYSMYQDAHARASLRQASGLRALFRRRKAGDPAIDPAPAHASESAHAADRGKIGKTQSGASSLSDAEINRA